MNMLLDLNCPSCGGDRRRLRLNVKADNAECNSCGTVFRLSAAVTDRRTELKRFFDEDAEPKPVQLASKFSFKPPKGSDITAERLDKRTFKLTAAPAPDLRLLIFGGVVITGLIVATVLMLNSSAFPSFFAFGSGLGTLGLIRWLLLTNFRYESVDVSPAKLILNKRTVFNKRRLEINTVDLTGIEMGIYGDKYKYPCGLISLKRGSVRIFKHLSERDQLWLVQTLRSYYRDVIKLDI